MPPWLQVSSVGEVYFVMESSSCRKSTQLCQIRMQMMPPAAALVPRSSRLLMVAELGYLPALETAGFAGVNIGKV